MSRSGFWTQLCITKPLEVHSYYKVRRTNFLQVQKGQQCNYCIAVKDKQKLFLPQSVNLKTRSKVHC